jgi:hypothetical protein
LDSEVFILTSIIMYRNQYSSEMQKRAFDWLTMRKQQQEKDSTAINMNMR